MAAPRLSAQQVEDYTIVGAGFPHYFSFRHAEEGRASQNNERPSKATADYEYELAVDRYRAASARLEKARFGPSAQADAKPQRSPWRAADPLARQQRKEDEAIVRAGRPIFIVFQQAEEERAEQNNEWPSDALAKHAHAVAVKRYEDAKTRLERADSEHSAYVAAHPQRSEAYLHQEIDLLRASMGPEPKSEDYFSMAEQEADYDSSSSSPDYQSAEESFDDAFSASSSKERELVGLEQELAQIEASTPRPEAAPAAGPARPHVAQPEVEARQEGTKKRGRAEYFRGLISNSMLGRSQQSDAAKCFNRIRKEPALNRAQREAAYGLLETAIRDPSQFGEALKTLHRVMDEEAAAAEATHPTTG